MLMRIFQQKASQVKQATFLALRRILFAGWLNNILLRRECQECFPRHR